MSKNLSHLEFLRVHLRFREETLADKRQEYASALARLASDLMVDGGPRWESSSQEVEWRVLRTQIRSLEDEIRGLREVLRIAEQEGVL